MSLRSLAIPIGFMLAFLVLWLMWPSPINPVAWDEPEPPELAGPLAPNAALSNATIYQTGVFGAAKGIAVSSDNSIYFGTPAGDILRLDAANGDPENTPELVAHIADDVIFGLTWLADSILGIACAGGLYSLDLTNLQVRELTTGELTRDFGILTDLVAGPDGLVYFTDSSTRWTHDSERPGYYFDMLENRPNGLVLSWNPATRQTEVLHDRLYYPYGIELAADGQSVFVSEPFRYTIQRLWIAGPRSGRMEIVAENLPGMPAGLTMDRNGNLVVAMLSQRSRLLTFVHRNPGLTSLLIKLPRWLRPTDARPHGYILRLDPQTGDILDAFHDPDSTLNFISNVTVDAQGSIWFGSAFGGFVASFLPPDLPQQRRDGSGAY